MHFVSSILFKTLVISHIFLVQSSNFIKVENSSNQHVKSLILEWWKKNNEPKPFSCDFKIKTSYKDTFLNGFVAPQIKAYPCSDPSKIHTRFYFKGDSVKNGIVDGKGKLAYIDNKQWSKLPSERKKEITEQNICLFARDLLQRNVREIIGGFKNGLLHGTAKVSYDGDYFSIATYKKGKVHGYQRVFTPNGTLEEAGIYEKGWPTGRHWKVESSNLILYDRSMITDDLIPSLVFPISRDGKLKETMAGNYYPYSGALDNIHRVKLIGRISNHSSCVLDVKYQLQEKETYSYSMISGKKFSLLSNTNDLLCNIVKTDENRNPSIKLNDWLSAIDSIVNKGYDKTKVKLNKEYDKELTSISKIIQHHKRAHEVLWRLQPLKEEPNLDSSLKLISDVKLDENKERMTAKILGSSMLEIRPLSGEVTFDRECRPHGFNDFQVIDQHKLFIPKVKALGWRPVRIIGFFHHGTLNGFTSMTTDRNNLVWGIVRHGVLHGPTITFGINFIMEEVS